MVNEEAEIGSCDLAQSTQEKVLPDVKADSKGAVKFEAGRLDSSSGECTSGDDQTQNGHTSGKSQQQQKDDSCDEDAPAGAGTIDTGNGTRRTDGSSDKDCNTTANLQKSPQQTEDQSKDSKPKLARPEVNEPCPRCQSADTKFCYFNNYNPKQPRFFCKSCQRYWTSGGTLRNVAPGAGRRKSKSIAAKEAEKNAELLAKSNFPMPSGAGAYLPAAYTNALLVDPMLAYSAQQQQQQQLLSGLKLPISGVGQWGDLGSAGLDPRLLGASCEPLYGTDLLPGSRAGTAGTMGLPMEDSASVDGRRQLLKMADGSAATPSSPSLNPMLTLLANNSTANGSSAGGASSTQRQGTSEARSSQQQQNYQQQASAHHQGFEQYHRPGLWGASPGSIGASGGFLELQQQQQQQQQASMAALAAAATQHQQNQQALQLQAAQLQAAAAAGSVSAQWGGANAANGLLNPYWPLGPAALANGAGQWPYNSYPSYHNQAAMNFMTQQLLAGGNRALGGTANGSAISNGLPGSTGALGMPEACLGAVGAGLPWGSFNPSAAQGLNPQQIAMLQQLNNGSGGIGAAGPKGLIPSQSSGDSAACGTSLLGKHARS